MARITQLACLVGTEQGIQELTLGAHKASTREWQETRPGLHARMFVSTYGCMGAWRRPVYLYTLRAHAWRSVQLRARPCMAMGHTMHARVACLCIPRNRTGYRLPMHACVAVSAQVCVRCQRGSCRTAVNK